MGQIKYLFWFLFIFFCFFGLDSFETDRFLQFAGYSLAITIILYFNERMAKKDGCSVLLQKNLRNKLDSFNIEKIE